MGTFLKITTDQKKFQSKLKVQPMIHPANLIGDQLRLFIFKIFQTLLCIGLMPIFAFQSFAHAESKHQLTLGVETSSIHYTENSIHSSQLNLSAMAHYRYYLSNSKLNFNLGGYYPLSVLTSNMNQTAEYLGFDSSLGYRLTHPSIQPVFNLTLGGFYDSMLVQNQAYGFSNMFGPQLGFTLTEPFSLSHSLCLFVRYAVGIDHGLRFASINKYEIGAIGYYRKIFTLIMIKKLNVQPPQDSRVISSQTINLGLGLTL